MEKEFMNEICQRGKGSRGGKGAWRRKRPNKVFTRNQSQKEKTREGVQCAALARTLKKKFSTEDAKKAETLLSDHFKMPAIKKNGISAFWAQIAAEPGALFVLMGDEQHREALKLVYALTVRVAASDQREMHIRIIAEHLEKRFQKGTRKRQNRKILSVDDLLRAITRLRIDFGNPDDEDDRYQVWRMAAAIRYLISKKVAPHQVDSFHKKNGGGLHRWALLAPKTTTKEKAEIALEAKVISEDRHSSPLGDDYFDDVPVDPNAPEPRKLTGFESILLRYCVDDMNS